MKIGRRRKMKKERIGTGRGKKPWFKRSEMHGDLPTAFQHGTVVSASNIKIRR